MTSNAEQIQPIESTDTDGLEDFFEAEVVPGTPSVGPGSTREALPGITVKEAAKQLGLSAKTIKDRLRKGSLKGFKVDGKFGQRWMVAPTEIGTPYQVVPGPTEEVLPGSTWEALPTDPLPGNTKEGVPGTTNLNLDRLLEQLEKKDRELQAAVYRNGYLESQLEVARNEVKLLPDLQSKAAQVETQNEELEELRAELAKHKGSRWHRFMRWFLGD